MAPPATRLFHLHYHVPDVDYAERSLAKRGFPVRSRFVRVDDELVSFGPAEDLPDEFRFRLQDSQRGYANVTLTSGKEVYFEHFGLVTADFEAVVDRAMSAEWYVLNVDQPRTFLTTPWGFRIELHRTGDRVDNSLGRWEEAHFSDVVLTVSDAEAVTEGLAAIVGDIPCLTVREHHNEHPHVPQATVSGTAFPEDRTLQASGLESG